MYFAPISDRRSHTNHMLGFSLLGDWQRIASLKGVYGDVTGGCLALHGLVTFSTHDAYALCVHYICLLDFFSFFLWIIYFIRSCVSRRFVVHRFAPILVHHHLDLALPLIVIINVHLLASERDSKWPTQSCTISWE